LDAGGGIGGTATLQLGGTGTLTGTGSLTLGNIPAVAINTPGTLTLAGTIRTTNAWTYLSGTIVQGTSTVVFAGTLTINGSHALGNVIFCDSSPSTATTYTITANTVLTVKGTLTLSSGGTGVANDVINTGVINALGDVNVLDAIGGIGGTAILQFGGTGTFTGAGTATLGTFPPIVINTPGTLNLAGTIRTTNNWTYLSGNIVPGTSTVIFAAAITISGSHTLGNVTFNDATPGTNVAYTVSAGTTLAVGGTLSLSSGGANAAGDSINTGTLNA
jgi:hypothetical protein